MALAMIDHDVLERLERFIQELAAAAALESLPLFRMEAQSQAGLGQINKDGHIQGFDPVTEADKASERSLRRLIAERFADHGVIGEEYGEDRPDAEFVWVLDPIDGTRAFISGLPMWTCLIGLRHYGRPILGAISQPYVKELYLGSALGARLITPHGTRPLKVRATQDLSSAILATTDPYLFQGDETKAFESLRRQTRLIRYGCDAYAFAQVAAGQLDGAFETGLKAWDIEAIIPVITHAGGTVCNWHGQEIGPSGGQVIASASPELQAAILQHLRPAAQ